MDGTKWTAVPGSMSGNEILQGDGFYISFARNPGMGISMWAADGGAETALVKTTEGERGKFYILNGDWRKKYAEVFEKGFDACLAVYKANKKRHRSSWSEDAA